MAYDPNTDKVRRHASPSVRRFDYIYINIGAEVELESCLQELQGIVVHSFHLKSTGSLMVPLGLPISILALSERGKVPISTMFSSRSASSPFTSNKRLELREWRPPTISQSEADYLLEKCPSGKTAPEPTALPGRQ